MTTVIKRNAITETALHEFTTCASDIGLGIAEWPSMLHVEGKLGNGLPFGRTTKKLDSDGTILYVRYSQAAGCTHIVVYND